MATIHVVLANVSARGDTGGSMPVMDSAPVGVATITSSGTSQLSGITAAGPNDGLVWFVTAKDGAVWVNTGSGTPVAASGSGWLIPSGQWLNIAVSVASEKLAIKDA